LNPIFGSGRKMTTKDVAGFGTGTGVGFGAGDGFGSGFEIGTVVGFRVALEQVLALVSGQMLVWGQLLALEITYDNR